MRSTTLIPLATLSFLAPASTPSPNLALVWEVTGEAYEGQMLPVDLWLVNTSKWGVWVLPALDGSSRDMRFPHVGVYSLNSGEPERFFYGGCGYANVLRVEDFVWLEPGQRLQIDGGWSVPPLNTEWEPLPAGQHTLLATYDATPYLSGFGSGQKEHEALLWYAARLPWGEVRTAPLEITVHPAP